MAVNGNSYFELFDDPLRLYNAMLTDIEQAKEYIYIETYRFGHDNIGIKFRDALTKKCKEGIEVKLLLDSWATSVPSSFFSELISYGGDVRFYKKIKFYIDFFSKNHRRNHRKLLIIDDKITYMGSANYTAYSLNWREMVIKVTNDLVPLLKKTFINSYRLRNKYIFNKRAYFKIIKHNGFEIVQDIPSVYRQLIRKRYEELIRNAKKEVIVETPYFVPSLAMRKTLAEAGDRGVDVKIIVPKNSDVHLVDLLRNKYLGYLHKHNVHILLYEPYNLHAKTLLVDGSIFAINSANFDYRSFCYQYEIALFGKDKNIIEKLTDHMQKTIESCQAFDYERWENRSALEKFFGWLLIPFRHLL